MNNLVELVQLRGEGLSTGPRNRSLLNMECLRTCSSVRFAGRRASSCCLFSLSLHPQRAFQEFHEVNLQLVDISAAKAST